MTVVLGAPEVLAVRIVVDLGWPPAAPEPDANGVRRLLPLGWPAAAVHVSRETPPEPGLTAVGAAAQTDLAADPGLDVAPAPGGVPAAEAVRVPAGGEAAGARLPRPTGTRVVAVANQKGGVGKTTTTVNVAAGLALAGLSVLVLDMDPQGNTSTGLGVPHSTDVLSLYDVLIDGRPMADVAVEVPDLPGLRCAPASIDLAGAEIELVAMVARELRLARALRAYLAATPDGRPVDYVLIDCPPSLGLLTVNALVAAGEVLIPIQCEFYALEGLGQLVRNVELVRSHLNPDLEISTILLTMYDARTRLAEQVAAEVRTHFGDRVLTTAVPRSIRISEAPGYGQPVLLFDPASRGARSYRDAAREFALRGAVAGSGGAPRDCGASGGGAPESRERG